MKKVVVIGAGISGLTFAYTLYKHAKGAVSITLIEKSARVGGWIQTVEKEGFKFERGPRGFLESRKGKSTLALALELGLQDELIRAPTPRRYLLLHQKLQPLTLFYLLRSGFFTACLKERNVAFKEGEESIGEFFTRRFGTKVTETLIDPLIKGIHGGSLWDLSMNSAWPLVKHWEMAYGSVVKGFCKEKQRGQLLTFKRGMQTLPEALYNFLKDKIDIRFSTEKVPEADHVISSLPPPGVKHLTLTTVNLGWKNKVFHKKGFGYLIPSCENESVLGVTFDSEMFGREKSTRLCVMLAGSPPQALEIAQDALKRHLGITAAPNSIDIHVAHNAIPQYQLGHAEKIRPYNTPFFIGNCFEGAGVNDCIERAQKCAYAFKIK